MLIVFTVNKYTVGGELMYDVFCQYEILDSSQFFLLVVGVLQLPSNKYSLQLISILLKTLTVSHMQRMSRAGDTLPRKITADFVVTERLKCECNRELG